MGFLVLSTNTAKSSLSIVVVDDNEILARAWKRILAPEEATVFVTTNPESALDYLSEHGADLLICDIVMPRMDGFELIGRLQSLASHPRIILTTGYVCDFTRLKMETGSDDVHVLMKPYNDVKEIRRFIRRILDGDHSLDDEEDSFKSLDDTRVHLWSL